MRKSQQDATFYQAIPKIELHRHLEGSLRLETLQEVARSSRDTVPSPSLPPPARLPALVQVNTDEPHTFQNFLSKFDTLRRFYRSPEMIGRISREAVTDAAADNVRYLELRFTPVALSRARGFSLSDVVDWVIAGVKQAQQERRIDVGLIVSVNRHESIELAEQMVQLAVEHQQDGISGIDLCGNEASFPAAPFAPLFKEARQAGLKLVVHAGEWGGPENVREAIELFEADRIGHGIRVIEDPRVVELARQRQSVFEVSLTSNYQSGVVPALTAHPLLSMLEAGLNITLNTDDPSICRITLSDEYQLAHTGLGLPLEVLGERILAAAQASFLPAAARQHLVESLDEELGRVLKV